VRNTNHPTRHSEGRIQATWVLTSLENSGAGHSLRTIALECGVWQKKEDFKYIQIMKRLKIMFFVGHH
jgi:hypothetical protein